MRYTLWIIRILAFLFTFSAFSCVLSEGSSKVDSTNEIIRASSTSIYSEVHIQSAMLKSFDTKILVNGLIQARQKIALKSELGSLLDKFSLQVGQRISKGQRIAEIDTRDLVLERAVLKTELVQAELDKAERILMMGGEFGQDSSVTKDQLRYAEIKAGVTNVKDRIAQTDLLIIKSTILSPFDAIVADVKVRQHQMIAPGEELCTLIDPSSYEAQFNITESSLQGIKVGKQISLTTVAYPDIKVKGTISRINPTIDENGLIKIYAKIHGPMRNLYDGMNISVEILTRTAQMIVIPKEAVVLRSERELVFVYDSAEKRAKWRYVTVAHENDTHVAISEGLKEGDLIITKGNLNLDHGAQVKVVEHTGVEAKVNPN